MDMDSRLMNSAKNVYYAVISQILNIVIKFGVRTIFIQCLGKEYLGVNGVFSNIISMLSLAELGIGTAIVYDMYKPIAINDQYKITQLVRFYQKVYFCIGLIILGGGLALIPLLPYIITDIESIPHMNLIYVMFLMDSVSTYFFAQYRSLIIAYQLNRIISKNNMMISIVKSFLQIIVLLLFKNFVAYLVIQIICTILGNRNIYYYTRKKLPFVFERVEKIGRHEVSRIVKNAVNMLSIKIGQTVVNSTDNILISMYLSTMLVGVYSNYSLVISIVLTAVVNIVTAIQASIGNLCVDENYEKKEKVLEHLQFGFSWIYCVAATQLSVLLTPFISLWLGAEYELSWPIVLLVIVNFYLLGIKQPIELYINAGGLFRYFRLKPWVEVAVNLVVSVFGVKVFGLMGVFIGTAVSNLCTTLWYDTYVVYKHMLHRSPRSYYARFIKFTLITVFSAALSVVCSSYIDKRTIHGFLLSGVLCLLISNVLFIMSARKDDDYLYFKDLYRQKLKKVFLEKK